VEFGFREQVSLSPGSLDLRFRSTIRQVSASGNFRTSLRSLSHTISWFPLKKSVSYFLDNFRLWSEQNFGLRRRVFADIGQNPGNGFLANGDYLPDDAEIHPAKQQASSLGLARLARSKFQKKISSVMTVSDSGLRKA
jgi:hypothetical protein